MPDAWRKRDVTTQGLRPYGPHCVRTYPSGFVVVRLNQQADSGVGGSAAPIISAHHHSAPDPIAHDGVPKKGEVTTHARWA